MAIWVLYEFDDSATRQRFLDNLRPEFSSARLYEAPQKFLDHWVDGKLSQDDAGMDRLKRLQ